MASFVFTGKLRKLKENGYSEDEFSGGLIKKRVQFQMICGDDTQWLDVSAFVWKDENKNKIMTYKHVTNGKDEKLEVAWDDRFNPAIIESVAGYRRWVVDTDTKEHRDELKAAGQMEELESSLRKKKEFLHPADFVEYLNKVLNNEKSKDMVFKVTGSVEWSYSNNKDQYYRSFVPQKIIRVTDDAEQSCVGSMKVYFASGAADDTMADETGDTLYNAYVQYYNTSIKANSFAPIGLVMNKDEKKAKGIKLLFNKADGDEVKELGLTVKFINGAKRVAITEDMLTDEQRELLEAELITMKDIELENGGNTVFGDRVTETRITGLMIGYSKGVQPTVFTADDLTKKPVKEEVSVDIFSDDDDEI